jgi:hypothetical protein
MGKFNKVGAVSMFLFWYYFVDVTSVTKNFSMTFMQQVSAILGHALNLLGVKEEIVRFWLDLDECVRLVFRNQEPGKVANIKEKFVRTLKVGKVIFPGVMKKRPQNIHNVLEFLEIDLELWVSAYLISGAQEEHKHQVYKGGASFTNGIDSEAQLVERERVVSSLRLLLHGGSLGQLRINKELRSLTHPNNEFAPHPLLSILTSYAGTEEQGKKVIPRKFFYSNKRRLVNPISPSLITELSPITKVSESGLPVIPSQQVVVQEKVFGLEDSAVVQSRE